MTFVPSPDIVLYGGGFDPPHQGHLDCIRAVRQNFPSVHIKVLPAVSPVCTGGGTKSPRFSFETRMEFCRLSFVLDSGLDDVVVSDAEANLPKPNFTLNLVEYYKNVNKNERIALLIGLDQFRVFDKWREPLKILSICDLLVISRDGGGSLVPCVEEVIAHRLGLGVTWLEEKQTAKITGEPLESKERYIRIISDATTCVSSSQIRNLIESGENIPRGWLTPSVEEKLKHPDFI